MNKQKTGTGRDEILSQCGAFAVRRASRLITQLFDEHLQPKGLRSTQFTVLTMLSGGRTLTMTELARELIVSPSTLSRNLRPLLRDGYLDIGRGHGRFKTVRLTTRGERVWQDAVAYWERGQRRFLQLVGAKEWAKLAAALEHLVGGLRDEARTTG